MGLVEKLEQLINKALLYLGSLIMRGMGKLIPPPVKSILSKLAAKWVDLKAFLKASPKLFLTWLLKKFGQLKSDLLGFDVKGKLKQTYAQAMAQYAENKADEKISKVKKTLLAPFLMVGQWLKGLSVAQSLMLLGFTAASFLSIIEIGFSGKRLVDNHLDANRAPASVEEEISYDRPEYYKRQRKHFDLTNLRLPVYFANVNELRSVDVDFTARISNRQSRMQLEKLEFQLRDHLILQIEPMVASFPLEDEGKEILREKLIMELNDFMASRGIEGTVEDLKITYVLAN